METAQEEPDQKVTEQERRTAHTLQKTDSYIIIIMPARYGQPRPPCTPASWARAAREHEIKMASSRNVPCWYQGCALDSQEDKSLELISHGSVKMRSIVEATAG
jgi:hypothetical protein